MIRKVIKKHVSPIKASSYISAAEEDDFNFDDVDESIEDEADEEVDEGIAEEEVEEEPVDEDDIEIDVDNNISNHYIAECDSCKGIFISAVVESEQEVEYVSGVCPLCGKTTDQYLKWVIRDLD